MNEILKIEKAQDRLAVLRGEWRLTPDGEPFVTGNSLLQAVLYDGLPAMVKIAMVREEYRGRGRWVVERPARYRGTARRYPLCQCLL